MKLEVGIIALLGLGIASASYMSWNIGANDVANAMGTSVGSRALTLRQAIVAACVANVLGAVLVGGHVADTLRKGVLDTGQFQSDAHTMMLGMLSALLAAGLWIQLSSFFGIPVSTTQAIVGGVVGFGVIAAGAGAIQWSMVGSIGISWVLSPAISATLALLLARLVRGRIVNAPDPIGATRRWTPVLVFSVFFSMCLVIFYKGLKNLHLDLPWQSALTIAMLVGGLAAVFGWILVGRADPAPEDHEALADADQERRQAELTGALERALEALKGAQETPLQETNHDKIHSAAEVVEGLVAEMRDKTPVRPRDTERSYRFVERVFASLQVVSACCVAFAQGSNDVGNAIGPFASLVNIIQTRTIADQVPVPLWTLLLGGVFIAIGIATWGPRVMKTIGEGITHLTPTRGFSAEFATAITVVGASRLGLPVSTTHVIVGAVMGVGLSRGVRSVDWRTLRRMATMWMVQVPAAACIAGLLFILLRAIIPPAF